MNNQKWSELNRNGSSSEKMKAFLQSEDDAFAILQLSFERPEVTAYERFESLDGLERQGKKPNIEHYDVIYIEPLPLYDGDIEILLEKMYERFNINHSDDYKGHSLSVSDIVALRRNGVVSCHYVDSIGFRELQNIIQS